MNRNYKFLKFLPSLLLRYRLSMQRAIIYYPIPSLMTK